MEKDNYDNPFANVLLVVIVVSVFAGGIHKALAKISSVINAIFVALGHVAIFVAVAFVVGFLLTLLCKLPRQWGGSPIDFRFSATGISVISFGALIAFGMPTPDKAWFMSVWVGILFGGPTVFWFLAKKNLPIEEERIREATREPLLKKIEELNEMSSFKTRKNYDLSDKVRELKAEIEKLKKQEWFLSKAEKITDPAKPARILESEDELWKGQD